MILEGEKKARVHPLRSKNYIAPKAIPHNGNPRTDGRAESFESAKRGTFSAV